MKFGTRVAVAVSVATGFMLWLVLSPGGRDSAGTVSNLGLLLASLAAGRSVLRRAATGGATRPAWLLTGVSCFLWAGAQSIWAFAELVLGQSVPFPSVGDVLFGAALIVGTAALFRFPSAPTELPDRARMLLDGLLVAGALLLVAWVTILEPTLSASKGPSTWAEVLTIAYPLGEIARLSVFLVVIARARRGWTSLTLLGLGLFVLSATESVYAFLLTKSAYSTGDAVDVGWMVGFLLMALAGQHLDPDEEEAAEPSGIRVMLPFLPLLVVGTILGVSLRPGAVVDGAEKWIGAAIFTIVALRQVLTHFENVRLTADLNRQVNALATQERRFRSLVENSYDIVTVVDAENRISYQTAPVERILGYRPSDLLGTSFFDLVHPDDAPSVTAILSGSGPTGGPAVCRIRNAANDWRHCEVTATNLLDEPAVAGVVLNTRDVTDAYTAHLEVMVRGQQLNEAQVLAQLGSWEVDLSTGRIQTSDTAFRLIGLEPGGEVMSLDSYRAHVHPDDLERYDEAFGRSFDRGKAGSVEFRFTRDDGDVRWFHARFECERDEDAQPVRMHGTVQDVTERRQAEEQIRFQSRLLDAVGQAVIARDSDRQVKYWNRAAEELFGWTAEEMMGRRLGETVMFNADATRADEIVDRLREGHAWSGEILLRRRDGTSFPAFATDAPVFDDSGQLIGMIGVTTDMSEHKDGEEALRQSEERLRGVLEAAPLAIIEFDVDGVVRFWNTGAELLYGWSSDEVTGAVPPFATSDGSGAFDALFRRAVAGDRIYNEEIIRRTKDGQALHVSVSMAPLRDASGAIVGVTSAGLDVTRQHALEAELRQAQKMEAVGRLAGGIAHDFNNILTVVVGYGELLLDDLEPGTPVAERVSAMHEAARRAAELTDQLLTFSRREAPSAEPVDLVEVVRSMEPILTRLVGEDVDLRVSLHDGALPVTADRSQLQQVVLNLAINARDAMPEGGRLDIVAASGGATSGDLAAVLEVSDTGAGMDESTSGRIFEPFFTTKGPGEGTGLGLSTVYGIVRQYGGSIDVASAVGRGTRFTINLPVTGSDIAAESETAAANSATHRGTVLLVEDEATVRALAREILEMQGHTVLEAADGLEGLRVAAAHPGDIDVLLTDVVLPQMAGPDLASRLRSQRPGLRIVFMSGYSENRLTGISVREDARFLAKPFRTSDLAHTIGEAVAAAR